MELVCVVDCARFDALRPPIDLEPPIETSGWQCVYKSQANCARRVLWFGADLTSSAVDGSCLHLPS